MSNEAIRIPDLGGGEDIEVVEISVAVGDQVAVDDILVVLESDKASMEIPSPSAGTVTAIDIAVGDKVAEGDIFAHLETATAQDAPEETAPQAEAQPSVEPQPAPGDAPAAAAEPQRQESGAEPVVVAVPEIGGAEGVEVIELMVAVGDTLSEGDTMLVLESDKASMEVPAPQGGKVVDVSLKVGDTVGEGSEILRLEPDAGSAGAAPVEPVPERPGEAEVAPATVPTPARDVSTTQDTSQAGKTTAKVHAGPAVRKLAREFGVDLGRVEGSGPLGRILKEDVQAFVQQSLERGAGAGGGIEPIPEVDFARFGPVRVEAMTSIQKLTAANMHRSWLNVPRVSQRDEIDITAMEKFRGKMKAELAARDIKLTPLPFLLKACATALRQHPIFNASLQGDGEHLVYKDYVHIGMAVDTPAGLMVPVIRDVDRKGLLELAEESAELAALAKARKLKPDQMQGGCFTISSLGNIGGTGFTPIINAPELAILGVSRLAVKPVWNGKKFKPRKLLPLTLAYDHRAINGAAAGRFMQDLGANLADVRRLLL